MPPRLQTFSSSYGWIAKMQLSPTGDGMDPPSINAALEVILMGSSQHNPHNSRRQLQSRVEAGSGMLTVVLPMAKHPHYFLSEGLTDRFPFTEWKLTTAFLELKGERDENRKMWLAVRGKNNGKALKGPTSLCQAMFSVLSQTLWRIILFLWKSLSPPSAGQTIYVTVSSLHPDF